MLPKQFFALFIGINGYEKCPPLSGCINDVLAMSTYFASFCAANGFEPHFKYLLAPADQAEAESLESLSLNYEPPTRARVIQELSQLFSNADPTRGDCCLLYYSGHGSTLRAPWEFTLYESSGLMQTLVCIDSRDEGQRDLVDKEIGYLVAKGLEGKHFNPHNPTQPGVQFVAIMDCCHAGNNMRSAKRKLVSRTTTGSHQPITAAELIGFDPAGNVFYEPLVDGRLTRNGLKHARYASLAASRDHESAQETDFLDQLLSSGDEQKTLWKEYGVFTYGLLRALYRSAGKLSYLDLARRIELELFTEGFSQRPLAWAPPDTEDLQLGFFQSKLVEPKDGSFQITYHKDWANGPVWTINAGQIHGISASSPEQPTLFLLKDGSGRKVAVKEIYTNYSILEPSAFQPEDQEKLLRATIHQWAIKRLKVGADPFLPDEWRKKIKSAFTRQLANNTAFIEWVEDLAQVPQIFVKMVLDAKKRPNLMAVFATSDVPLFICANNQFVLTHELNKVGKWYHTLQIANPIDEARYRSEIEVEIQALEGKKIEPSEVKAFEKAEWPNKFLNPDQLDLRYINGVQPQIKVKITTAKSSLESYYIGALYLDAQFGINPDVGSVKLVGIEGEVPAMRLEFKASELMPIQLNAFFHEYGVTEITDYLLIFVSSEPFNLDHFKQSPIIFDEATRGKKGLGDDEDGDWKEQFWFTLKIPIRVQRPIPAVQLSNERHTFLSRQVKPGQKPIARKALNIQAHREFKAKVQAFTPAQLQQATRLQLPTKSATEPQPDVLPPTQLWQGANAADNPFCLGLVGNSESHLNILDFSNPVGEISWEHPLVMTPGDALQNPFQEGLPLDERDQKLPQELVIPYGQLLLEDGTGFYVPFGFTDLKGDIRLTRLPTLQSAALDPAAPEGARSVGTALRAFFQKLVWSRLSGRHDYNTLALQFPGAKPILYRSNVDRYKPAREGIRTVLKEAKKVLLLIHGIIGETEKMLPAFLQHPDLSADFDAILTFDYENLDTEIEKTARNLKAMLLDCGLVPEKRLTIVAHSMGGLVARYWIEKEGGAAYVHKLIQAGTPNAGSDIATFRQQIVTLMTFGINAVSRFKPYLAPLSLLTAGLGQRLFHTLDQMKPGSEFLQGLNNATAPNVPYYLLAGDTTHIEAVFKEDDPLWKVIWNCLRDRTPYILADTIIFKDEPNDMAVRTESMKALPWGHSKVLEPVCDHLSYFDNGQSIEMLKELIVL